MEAHRHLSRKSSQGLDAAVAAGDPTVDLVYEVPPWIGPACAHMVDLLHSADREAVDQQLLVPPPDRAEATLRDWYFSEIARQVRGEAPRSWPDHLAALR
ncbi:MAG: hypothetical protein M3P83_09975 [Actinomycetota bacterium]|nr:hypothetical protein [Actinomycetota bacterium]